MTNARKALKSVNAFEAAVALAAPVFAAVLTLAVLHASLWALLVVMALGYACSVPLFRHPPRAFWASLLLVCVLALGIVVLVAAQDSVGPMHYAWILSYVSGSLLGGRSWGQRFKAARAN